MSKETTGCVYFADTRACIHDNRDGTGHFQRILLKIFSISSKPEIIAHACWKINYDTDCKIQIIHLDHILLNTRDSKTFETVFTACTSAMDQLMSEKVTIRYCKVKRTIEERLEEREKCMQKLRATSSTQKSDKDTKKTQDPCAIEDDNFNNIYGIKYICHDITLDEKSKKFLCNDSKTCNYSEFCGIESYYETVSCTGDVSE